MSRWILLSLVICSCLGCRSPEYYREYAHLSIARDRPHPQMHESAYFVVLLVEARHLDYTSNRALLQSLVKHPSDGSKNSDVGHAWIYLQGCENGELVCLEGGHSGELGLIQPKYFEGIIDDFEAGSSNPIQYLWACQKDGFFEEGNGGHYPTYAAKVDLTKEQYQKIVAFIHHYDYAHYYLTHHQCTTFVVQIAELAGLTLDHTVTIEIDPVLHLCGDCLPLWSDPQYATFTFSTPDVLERSLMHAVWCGEAEFALDWYRVTHLKSFEQRCAEACRTLRCFPYRFGRYLYFCR